MATLILTTVGSLVGGPIGGAVGALIGQQADAALFAPKARRGPRLGDLAVQTSSYGTPIPRLFGRMRVAGTVIWATDLKEERSSSGGGKGRPRTVNYSYSASFAVALSGRAIRGVGRIWADGKLLRGTEGDFKTETGFRLHPGDEDQDVDPLIAAAEGFRKASAFRGLAYALFEDFQLADYGNRIPSLSFEVEADEGSVTIGGIAEVLSDGEIEARETAALLGYAAGGDSVRGAIEALAEIAPLSLTDEGGRLRLGIADAPAMLVFLAEAGVGNRGAGGRTEINRRAGTAMSGEVSIAYYEPARDWQTGLQRATVGGSGHRSDRIALPAALEAAAAKSFAEERLARVRAARTTAVVGLGWRQMGVRPGALVRIEGQSGVWRVERWTLQAMVVQLELVQMRAGTVPADAGADPGRPTSEPDLLHGTTVLKLMELPLAIGQGGGLQLLAAAAGANAGWRRAALTISTDGTTWQAAGQTAAPAVIGHAVTAIGRRGSALFDTVSAVEIELLNDAMWLEGRSDAALAGGANLALLGDELIQFGRAEAIAPGRFRLSRLLRGRRGTEWAAATHVAGEEFVLIEAESVAALDLAVGLIGGEARVIAQGIGDDAEGVTASRTVTGETIRPPAPVHLRVERDASGDILIRWVRRSRNGWGWSDGGDVPLVEESESYRLTLAGDGFERVLMLGTPAYTYTAAEQAADGAGPLTISVLQIGTFAASRAATTMMERP